MDGNSLALTGNAEQGFGDQAVRPARGAGVPAPAATPAVRILRVDISGHRIMFCFIAIDSLSAEAVIDRIDHRLQLPRAFNIALSGEVHYRPDSAVGVLPIILPYARQIAANVVGVRTVAVELWRQ